MWRYTYSCFLSARMVVRSFTSATLIFWAKHDETVSANETLDSSPALTFKYYKRERRRLKNDKMWDKENDLDESCLFHNLLFFLRRMKTLKTHDYHEASDILLAIHHKSFQSYRKVASVMRNKTKIVKCIQLARRFQVFHSASWTWNFHQIAPWIPP